MIKLLIALLISVGAYSQCALVVNPKTRVLECSGGTGNVVGPASSANGAVAYFNGTDGKTLAGSSYLTWTDQTAAMPTGVLTIGSGTQAFELGGRGTDSGVSHGVPYFRSAAANTNTAWDLMPNGNPATTAAGTVWMDVCSNDLQPLNSDAWNCAIFGVSGYVFYVNNGSLVSVVDSGSVATFTTLHPHRLTAGNSVIVSGGPPGLAATYTVTTTPTDTTFTVTTAGVTDGTYTTAGLVVSTAGNVVIGAHNTSNTAGATALLAGTSISFADRLGGTTRATLTGSKLGLGATETIAWYFNSGVQRMASTFLQRWSSTSSPDGTPDISLSRASANVLQVGDGSVNSNGAIKVSRVITNQSTPASSTDACTAGAIWADATFAYFCTASGAIKRVTLVAF